MAVHERSLEAHASSDRVWQIWSDVSTWPRWNPDVLSISIDGAFASGTTGRMTTRAGGTHAITLQTVQPGRSFRLETSPIPLGRFAFRCEVRPTGSGSSTISQSITIGGPLGPLYSAMMGRRIADGFEPILGGLKAAAEAGEGT
ncbi:MAG TPA: SRPBCC family protein [Candidatus Dormibacteraeota bacterium]|nr:SRPBCC family protein [Candidatus Dormibacteraeota bacterium]